MFPPFNTASWDITSPSSNIAVNQNCDKSTMAVYYENILLPKHVTHSFYATWLHCYEELFDASLSGKSLQIKFESNANFVRKDADKLSLEKATLCGISLDCDLNGTYTPTEMNRIKEEGEEPGNKEMSSLTSTMKMNDCPVGVSSYSSGRLFNSKKKTYRFSYNGDL